MPWWVTQTPGRPRWPRPCCLQAGVIRRQGQRREGQHRLRLRSAGEGVRPFGRMPRR
ncbi:MAG: hypothetical protein MZW92_22010 [Comamonadaceae bacterium]|nr:hypothetical protein [Comamonadaceae bacterium]